MADSSLDDTIELLREEDCSSAPDPAPPPSPSPSAGTTPSKPSGVHSVAGFRVASPARRGSADRMLPMLLRATSTPVAIGAQQEVQLRFGGYAAGGCEPVQLRRTKTLSACSEGYESGQISFNDSALSPPPRRSLGGSLGSLLQQTEESGIVSNGELPSSIRSFKVDDVTTEAEESTPADSLSDINKSDSEQKPKKTAPLKRRKSLSLRFRDLYSPNNSRNKTKYTDLSSASSTFSCYSTGHFLKKEKVDVVRVAFNMGLQDVWTKVFASLAPGDLLHAGLVSHSWRACLMCDRDAWQRREEELERRKTEAENLFLVPHTSFLPSPRKALQNVSNNLALSPSYGAKLKAKRERENNVAQQVSPNKVRHRLFSSPEESSPTEASWSQPCPRCRFQSSPLPSKKSSALSVSSERNGSTLEAAKATSAGHSIKDQQLAKCMWEKCKFEFCTRCSSESHVGSKCQPKIAKEKNTRSKGTLKQMRNRLRRL